MIMSFFKAYQTEKKLIIIFLNKDDYEFFQSLPNREKLLFLYDLCLEVEEFEEDNEEELFEPEEGSEK